jgi:hypothetical protein
MSRKESFIADRRGAVSFEMLVVFAFLMFGLLLPLADLAIAGFQYISAWAALRSFGQYIQYNNPHDPTDLTTWEKGLQTTVGGYTIGNIQVMCGEDASKACSNAALTPKYYTFTTTLTLAPMVLRSVLCPSTDSRWYVAASCTYTLPYSERFQ